MKSVRKPAHPTQSALENTCDYQRIEKAISYLDEHFLEQPDLASVARAVHLSEFHFQRLFSRWAGISPKRFLQFLTLDHAKKQLSGAKPVLETTLDSGLSSPGRLHDLFVSVESVTPGEFKSGGAGLEIHYGVHETPFGPCLLGLTRRGICWLSFLSDQSATESLAALRSEFPQATLVPSPERIVPVAAGIFSNLKIGKQSSLSLLLMGTNFQLKVWKALLKIPAGAVTTYESIGRDLGLKQSSRAIGNAVGHNRIAYLIPCHRVIRKTGAMGGYRWGQTRKRAMLAWESARAAA